MMKRAPSIEFKSKIPKKPENINNFHKESLPMSHSLNTLNLENDLKNKEQAELLEKQQEKICKYQAKIGKLEKEMEDLISENESLKGDCEMLHWGWGVLCGSMVIYH